MGIRGISYNLSVWVKEKSKSFRFIWMIFLEIYLVAERLYFFKFFIKEPRKRILDSKLSDKMLTVLENLTAK